MHQEQSNDSFGYLPIPLAKVQSSKEKEDCTGTDSNIISDFQADHAVSTPLSKYILLQPNTQMSSRKATSNELDSQSSNRLEAQEVFFQDEFNNPNAEGLHSIHQKPMDEEQSSQRPFRDSYSTPRGNIFLENGFFEDDQEEEKKGDIRMKINGKANADINDYQITKDKQDDIGIYRNNNNNSSRYIRILGLDYASFQQFFDYLELTDINGEKFIKKHGLKQIGYIYLLEIRFSYKKQRIRKTLKCLKDLEDDYFKFMKSIRFSDIQKNHLTIDSILGKDNQEKYPDKVLRIMTENLSMIVNQFEFNSSSQVIEEKFFYLNKTQKSRLEQFKQRLRIFLELSDRSDEGKPKFKEAYVDKRGGGRYKEGFCKRISCSSLCGCPRRRCFIVGHEGVMYAKGYTAPDSALREVMLYDYNFLIKHGKKHTGSEFGIEITTHSRTLSLVALTVIDFLDILYALKEAYEHSIYGGVHRFNSFAPPREKCIAKWYVDGVQYFNDVFDAIQSAETEIFITGWWVSPDFYLKRPETKFPESRVDTLLQNKANQGVKIFIIVYNEPEIALTIESKYTKLKLESLHPTNIQVARHPNYIIPFMWSHHEKLVIIDQEVGFLGGFDICYGRWDTPSHPLTDCEQPFIFPGIDYCNMRTKDFNSVQNHTVSGINRFQQQRMPWHDVGLRTIGLPVKDLAKHFIQYWNFTQVDIGNKGGNYGCLIPQEREGQHNMFKPYIKQFNQKMKGLKTRVEDFIKDKITKIKPEIENYLNDHSISIDFLKNLDLSRKREGDHNYDINNNLEIGGVHSNSRTNFELMLLREEKKPRDEIIQLLQQLRQIKQDNLYDEFEDQSDITIRSANSSFPELEIPQLNETQRSILSPEKNQGKNQSYNAGNQSMTDGKTGTRFSLYKSMFDKTIDGSITKIQRQLEMQKDRLKLQAKRYKTGEKGGAAALQQCQILRSASHWSLGLNKKDTESSIQIGYLTLINEAKHFIYIENQFFISSHAGAPVRNQISNALVQRIKKAAQHGEHFLVVVVLPLLPGFEGEIDAPNAGVMKIQLNWEYLTISRGGTSILEELASDPLIPDPSKYIQFYSLRQHGVLNQIPVTEILYVHSKMMIIDDQVVIIGSANINDRSLKGNRDSEIAAMIEDTEVVESKMNGVDYTASKFAHSLRCELFKEHFGLEQVQDPLSPTLISQMRNIAHNNTLLYREIFRCYPDDEITEMSQLRPFMESSQIELYQQKWRGFKGHAVEWPTKFLENENLKFEIHMKEFYVPEINFT